MSQFTLAELISVVNDLNNLQPPFETPLNNKETDINKVIAEITANAKDLEYDDLLTQKSKIIISRLKVGPWVDFVLTNEELDAVDKVVDAVIEQQREPEEMTVNEEPKNPKQNPVVKKINNRELSRYGHRKGTMSADIDEMLWQGVKQIDAVRTLAKKHNKTEKAALAKFLVHVRYLQKELEIPITIKEDHYKTTKAAYEKPV